MTEPAGLRRHRRRATALTVMSVKQQTLVRLSELPEDSDAWRELHEDARLLKAITAAEADVRAGRVHSLEDAKQIMEDKWALRRSMSV